MNQAYNLSAPGTYLIEKVYPYCYQIQNDQLALYQS